VQTPGVIPMFKDKADALAHQQARRRSLPFLGRPAVGLGDGRNTLLDRTRSNVRPEGLVARPGPVFYPKGENCDREVQPRGSADTEFYESGSTTGLHTLQPWEGC